MIIECTSCGARAKLPDSKEGAKVRCPECSHVYVARPPGARGRVRKEDPTKYIVIGGAIVLFGIIAIVASRSKSEEKPVVQAEESEDETVYVSASGWDSPLVVAARTLHDNVYTQNSAKLYTTIDFAGAHAHRFGPTDGETAEAGYTPWSMLGPAQADFKKEVLDSLLSGDDMALVSDWKPYDGHVFLEEGDQAIVRVKVQHREDAVANLDRWVEWRFVREGGKWKAWAWERWISPEEMEKERVARTKKTEKRTLSDGSLVIEGKVREEIAYHEETPQELRDEIEQQITILVDLELLPGERTAARLRLRDIGKHAVPGLLSRMGSIPIDSEEAAMELMQIHLLLQEMTGYLTTFDVSVAMGTTDERQLSGVKQWFGWYDRKFKRYWGSADTQEEGEDPFWDDPDFQPRNEKEKREFEKLRREHEEKMKKDG